MRAHLYRPAMPSSLLILVKASHVPLYKTFLWLCPSCMAMCCVWSLVLITQRGFVTQRVANPAPEAAVIWTIGGLTHALSAWKRPFLFLPCLCLCFLAVKKSYLDLIFDRNFSSWETKHIRRYSQQALGCDLQRISSLSKAVSPELGR